MTTEITFSEGIIGVARARHFELLEREDSPVRILRCLDINGFTLPVVDPRLADPGYEPSFNPRIVSALEFEDEDLPLLLAVATIESEGAVANLRAPLLINANKRLGVQVILEDRAQPLRAPVKTRT